MENKKINIGVIGCGTVGSHLIQSLINKKTSFYKKTGIHFEVVKVCDKDKKKKTLFPAIFTEDAHEITRNPEIDIVVELIGGIEKASVYIKDAIKNKKSIVTANKAFLSEKGEEIFELAEKNNVYIGFEASVAGSIPIIKTLRESFIGNKFSKMLAILNGTTNFILSKMTYEKLEFKETLLMAQKNGYAESNPFLDISGLDTAHKLGILTRFAFNKNVSWKGIFVEGIEKITSMDLKFAREFGYRVKLLAISKKKGNFLELRVHPALLPEHHLLSFVEDVYNGIYLEGDMIGKSLLYGEGAGGYAAASSVVSDIIETGMKLSGGKFRILKFPEDEKLRFLPFDEVCTKYYIRFTAVDTPGVLGDIAGILGENDISIASVIQKKENPEKSVPIVMLTHQAMEKKVQKALKSIDKLNLIKKPTVTIRVEE